jgi:hypothetical protein
MGGYVVAHQQQVSMRDLVSQLRQTGQMPSLQGTTMSKQQVTTKDLGNQTPSVARAVPANAGGAPANRQRNLPREQGKPGPDLGMAR